MTNDISTRLDELTDHVFAVQLMLLSHIAATEKYLPGSLEETLVLARQQGNSALQRGRNRIAIRLDMMTESLRQWSMGAAND